MTSPWPARCREYYYPPHRAMRSTGINVQEESGHNVVVVTTHSQEKCPAPRRPSETGDYAGCSSGQKKRTLVQPRTMRTSGPQQSLDALETEQFRDHYL